MIWKQIIRLSGWERPANEGIRPLVSYDLCVASGNCRNATRDHQPNKMIQFLFLSMNIKIYHISHWVGHAQRIIFF